MRTRILFALLSVFLLCGADDCAPQEPMSSSGVHKASVHVHTGSDGLTAEQRNIAERLKADNTPGSIKHLYVISPYSGQVLIYSTVRGKVTSGSKRLTPTTIVDNINSGQRRGFGVDIAGDVHVTEEVLGDDGAYGSSGDYLYWWDTRGVFRQHYLTGGQILHIASEPVAVKSVVLNMELAHGGDGAP